MIRSCFLSSAAENSKSPVTTPCLPAFQSLGRPSEKADQAAPRLLGRTVSNKVGLCQLGGGFQIGLDIARRLRVKKSQAIWE